MIVSSQYPFFPFLDPTERDTKPVPGYPRTGRDIFIASRAFHPDSVGGPVRTGRTRGMGRRGVLVRSRLRGRQGRIAETERGLGSAPWPFS